MKTRTRSGRPSATRAPAPPAPPAPATPPTTRRRTAPTRIVARIVREDGRRWLVGVRLDGGTHRAFLRLESGGSWQPTDMVGRTRDDVLEVIGTAWALPAWHLEWRSGRGFKPAA